MSELKGKFHSFEDDFNSRLEHSGENINQQGSREVIHMIIKYIYILKVYNMIMAEQKLTR